MSSSNHCFLTCIQVSQEAGQVVWYSHLFQNFPQFIVIHTVDLVAFYVSQIFILHASKVILKILQVRLQQYMNHELTDVQTGFRKERGTRDQIANIFWIIEKA